MIIAGVAILTAMAMEPWAEWVHRVVWHGPLWSFHRDHHHKRHDRIEWNDVLSASHAPIAITAIFSGIGLEGTLLGSILLGIGIGMTTFGVGYVVVHDGFVHGRLPVGFLARSSYFRFVRDAHLVHHQGDHGPYGLFAPTRIGARDAPRLPRRDRVRGFFRFGGGRPARGRPR